MVRKARDLMPQGTNFLNCYSPRVDALGVSFYLYFCAEYTLYADLHRFFTYPRYWGTVNLYYVTDPGLMQQLLRVFRYKEGQEVIFFDGSGFDYTAEIHAIEKAQTLCAR